MTTRILVDTDSVQTLTNKTLSGTAISGLLTGPTDVVATGGTTARSLQDRFSEVINVKDHAAKGDGVTDDTPAIQAAINAGGSNCAIYFPPGTYLVTSTLTVSSDRVHITGAGPYATILLFAPISHDTCLSITNGASVIYQGSVSNLAFFSNDSTHTKIAIDLADSSGYRLENIVIGGGVTVSGSNYWSGGSGSIGLQVRGREFGQVRNLYAFADRPVYITDNPNSSIDIDHFHFQDLYLGSNTTFACVTITDGVNLSNVEFDGANPWVSGAYGFYWNDTTTAQVSNHLRIRGVRTEQGTVATAYSLYIHHNYALQNLHIEDVKLDTARRGVSLRKIQNAVFTAVDYGGLLEAFNATAEVNSTLSFYGCFWQAASTATLTNYVLQLGSGVYEANKPIPNTAVYVYGAGSSTDIIQGNILYFNVKAYKAKGDGVTDDASAITAALDAAENAGGGTVYFPAGTYAYATSPNFARRGVNILAERGAVFQHIGAGNAFILDGGSTGPGQGLFGNKYTNITVAGNSNSTNGIFVRAVHHYIFDHPWVKGCSAMGSGIRCDWNIGGEWRTPRVTVNEASWTTQPLHGMRFSQRDPGEDCAALVITDPIMEGLNRSGAYGLYFENAFSNTVIGGTSESNDSGLFLGTGAYNNQFLQFEMEANTVLDVRIEGFLNQFDGLIFQKGILIIGGTANNNLFRGGQGDSITIDNTGGTPNFNRFRDTIYGTAGGSFTDNGNNTIIDTLRNGVTGLLLNASALRSAVTATANLPAAAAFQDGKIIIEDAGSGDRNLIIYAGGQRFRIDGGAAF